MTSPAARAPRKAPAEASGSRAAGPEPAIEGFDPARRLAAETLGTALLLAVVVGSGVMGERLAGGVDALALLGNTLSTGAALTVLIAVFGPVSGAHFNPAVTAIFVLRREIDGRLAIGYLAAQTVGAILGVWAAHAMFAEPILQVSTRLRSGPGQVWSEAIATFGLVLTILATLRFRPGFTPAAVGLYIASAYWFTGSTSFTNPAVTLARTLSDTFAGIAPASAPGFWLGQALGTLAAGGFAGWLLRPRVS